MAPRLTDFNGLWRLTRIIREASGQEARFSGEARFAPDDAGLCYDESGELTLPGQAPVRAMRRYLWRPGAGGGIEVLFDDGRPFHRIAPGMARPQDRHHCDPDLYEVTYDFANWPEWRAQWRVRGPRKDYTLVSTYRRPGGEA